MKNLARLALFLSVSFIGLLLITALLCLLRDWAGWALSFSPGAKTAFSGNCLAYLRFSLPAAFYGSILLSLNYAARRRVPYPAVFVLTLAFVLALSGAVSLGLHSLEKAGVAFTLRDSPKEPAKPGFIANQGTAGGNQTIFLEDPYKADGAVVQLAPGSELRYASSAPGGMRSRLPFFAEKRSVFYSIRRDFEKSAQVFSLWFSKGFPAFGVYAGALAVLLLSLGCLVNISFWPLANLFFGALAYRGVLLMERFLNEETIARVVASFTGKMLPPSLINPAIFCALASLILLYSGLVYLARGKLNDG